MLFDRRYNEIVKSERIELEVKLVPFRFAGVDTKEGLEICISAETGTKIREWLLELCRALGVNCRRNFQIKQSRSANCLPWEDSQPYRLPSAKYWTFKVPRSPTCVALHHKESFNCVIGFNRVAKRWEIQKTLQRGMPIINTLCRGLDLKGWRLPSHWYRQLYQLIISSLLFEWK